VYILFFLECVVDYDSNGVKNIRIL